MALEPFLRALSIGGQEWRRNQRTGGLEVRKRSIGPDGRWGPWEPTALEQPRFLYIGYDPPPLDLLPPDASFPPQGAPITFPAELIFDRLRFEPVSPEEQPAVDEDGVAWTSAPFVDESSTPTAESIRRYYNELRGRTRPWRDSQDAIQTHIRERTEQEQVRIAEAALWCEYQAWRRCEGLDPNEEQCAMLEAEALAATACGQLLVPWMLSTIPAPADG